MIKLYFRRRKDKELNKKVKGIGILRIMCDVLFKTIDGEIDIYEGAIVDTGAFISLIPYSAWKNVEHKEIVRHSVKGIIPRKECAIDVIIGKIKLKLLDEENETNELEIYAYLALTDEVPLIIGFEDLLSRFKVCFDYSENEAWIEEK